MEEHSAKKYLNGLSIIESITGKLFHSPNVLRIDSWKPETDNDCRNLNHFFN